MNPRLTSKDILPLLVLFTGAVSAGIVNGLLGTGGGIILSYLYAYLLKGDGVTSKDRFVSAMITVLPISVLSLFTYRTEVLRDAPLMISVMLPSGLGGLCGAVISGRAKPVLLEWLFAAIVILAGIRMVK